MADIRVSQAQVLAAAAGPAGNVRITQAQVLGLIQYPAEEVHITQAEVRAAVESAVDVRITQAQVLAVVKGRVEDRRLRAWAFSLDGHDFYVLRLGERETLVCDLTTGQWSEWNTFGKTYWRAHVGGNWIGIGPDTTARGFGTDIVAGDDALGQLWMLDPTSGVDDLPAAGETSYFNRVVTGGVPQVMRTTAPCAGVYVTLSLGAPAIEGASVTLRTSDDAGFSWIDHGSITVPAGEYGKEIAWRSLGLIRHPGRIFEFSDDGAAVRISGADMR